ncbi:MAG: ATP-binding protein [Fibrobacter sp.]|nr:ATP-binding protein [Fibrobacter sp.]
MNDILHMSVRGLFGHLNYELDFERNDGFSIIAAPNSFGKSTILNSINALFSGDFFFFRLFEFSKMNFKVYNSYFDQNYEIEISRSDGLVFSFEGENHSVTDADISEIVDNLAYVVSRSPDEEKKLIKKVRATKDLFEKIKILSEYSSSYKLRSYLSKRFSWYKRFRELFVSVKTYVASNRYIDSRSVRTKDEMDIVYNGLFDVSRMEKSIRYKSLDIANLQEIISSEFSFAMLQATETNDTILDFNEDDDIFAKTKSCLDQAKQLESRLEKIDFFNKDLPASTDSLIKALSLDQSMDSKALINVYKKARYFLDSYSPFSKYLDRMELFESTLNKMLFFKKVRVKKDTIEFITENDGKILNYKDLSSGETQVAILIGFLLFDGVYDNKPMLVISDEPEISLHPAWQEILADFFYECRVKFNKRFVFASHSPIFIGNRWSQVIDLYKQGMGA